MQYISLETKVALYNSQGPKCIKNVGWRKYVLGCENKGSKTARSSTTAHGPLLEEEWGRFRLDFDTICPLYNRVMYLHVVKHPDGGHYLLWWSPSGTWNDNNPLIFNFFVFFPVYVPGIWREIGPKPISIANKIWIWRNPKFIGIGFSFVLEQPDASQAT